MSSKGRPVKDISVEQFEALCRMQCSIKEIAGFFNCGLATIERFCKRTYGKTFTETFAEKRVGGLISLRRAQFRLAEKNAAMAIWLGKQYLGQREDPDMSASEIMEKLDSIMKEMGGVV